MTLTLNQPSLSGGEISPSLYGRVDLARYLVSLKTCRNFIVQAYGGVKNRCGTRFVEEVKDSSKFTRLLPFAFSTEQAYALEVGEQYCRVIRNGALVRLGSTPSAWLTATAYVQGNHVSNSGTNYYCAEAHTSGTFATDLAAGKWLALTEDIVEFPTEWLEGDLDLLKTTQSADVLTVCHPDYQPTNISRTAHTVWTIAPIAFEFGPFDEVNTFTPMTVYSGTTSGVATLTGSTGLFDPTSDVGKLFYIEQKDKGQPWTSNTAVTTNDIRRANSKYWKALGTATTGYDRPDANEDNWHDGVVNWQFLHPGFGIGQITTCTVSTTALVSVVSRIPDAAVGSGGATYKWAKGIWNEADGYPGCTTYHQQRHFFAGSAARPQTIWGSRTGDFTNFGKSSPVVDDDAVTYPLAGKQVNQVRHLVSTPGGALLAFTSDGNWTLMGNENGGPLTPTSVQATPQEFRGTSHVAPLTVGNRALYIQDKGQVVRDLAYDFATNSYAGDDLSEMATHLLEGHTITDWCFQQVPFNVVWMVRDDGLLLGMTYKKEQGIAGWHRHDLGGGIVESCCVVSEGMEDRLYLIVRRTINGTTKRYIEVMENRVITDINDAFFVDCGLSYDGRNTGSATITVSGGAAWDHTETLTLTASSAVFATGTGDIGDAIVFLADDGTRYAFTIQTVNSTTEALAVANKSVPAAYRNTARADWAFARSSFWGLDHLEGETVAILADGNVHPQRVVASGSIDMETPAFLVHAGLPITAEVETLDIATYGGETIRDKKKLISEVGFQVESARGLKAGPDSDHLREYKQRSTELYDLPVGLYTGLVEVSIDGRWDKNARVVVRQEDPLPVQILSIIPKITMGGS